jgi:hypothetical protein
MCVSYGTRLTRLVTYGRTQQTYGRTQETYNAERNRPIRENINYLSLSLPLSLSLSLSLSLLPSLPVSPTPPPHTHKQTHTPPLTHIHKTDPRHAAANVSRSSVCHPLPPPPPSLPPQFFSRSHCPKILTSTSSCTSCPLGQRGGRGGRQGDRLRRRVGRWSRGS